jgi:hypothetical protein
MTHNFRQSLAKAQQYEDAPWWGAVYQRAFAGVESMVSVRQDGWAQRAGIDRVITLRCGRVIRVDEKVREKDWGDILLERWSDEQKKVPGWVQKPLACDFIAYAFVPSATCYLLPTLTLQKAWRANGKDWVERYKEIRADNGSYVTVSVAVPTAELFAALSDAMRVTWHGVAA